MTPNQASDGHALQRHLLMTVYNAFGVNRETTSGTLGSPAGHKAGTKCHAKEILVTLEQQL